MDKSKKIAIIAFSSAIILLSAIFLITYLSWLNNYQDRLPPNTTLGAFDVSGYSKTEVNNLLLDKEKDLRKVGIVFQSGEKIENFPLLAESLSPDIPGLNLKYADSLEFNHEASLAELFSDDGAAFLRYLSAKLFRQSYSYPLVFSYSLPVIKEWLEENFSELIIKPEPAYFSLSPLGDESSLINNSEKIGKEINWQEIEKDLERLFAGVENSSIIIKTRTTYPEIKQADLEPLREALGELLDLEKFLIKLPEELEKPVLQEFSVSRKDLVTWVSPEKNGQFVEISFNQEKIEDYLEEFVAPKVNEEIILPRFDLKDGRVSNWQTGKNGRVVNLETSAQKISNSLLNLETETRILIDVLSVDDLNIENDFKIRELLGTGHSNFAGSPTNRRHNIAVGAQAVHGMLMKPDEEFSLVKSLGNIDAAAGYLPELVIKGNKTIPEYGGGLCQVATTLFRSALSTGLPITARRNHSYRVSYYEPAGTDASVYDPWPDIKFVNDTGNYILIQSRIEGDDIYFDFWGTGDGRVATTTAPVIYNIVKPPPTKFIETDELAPGVKKCTERAHNGADAYFDYIVIYPENATTTPRQEVRFRSHYVPWQEVCLIGKTAPVPDTPDPSDIGAEVEGVGTENINE